MSDKEQAIRKQIAKYEQARKVTQARNGYRHYSDKINVLKGELALLKAQEAREADRVGAVPVGVDLCCECHAPLAPTEYGLCAACERASY